MLAISSRKNVTSSSAGPSMPSGTVGGIIRRFAGLGRTGEGANIFQVPQAEGRVRAGGTMVSSSDVSRTVKGPIRVRPPTATSSGTTYQSECVDKSDLDQQQAPQIAHTRIELGQAYGGSSISQKRCAGVPGYDSRTGSVGRGDVGAAPAGPGPPSVAARRDGSGRRGRTHRKFTNQRAIHRTGRPAGRPACRAGLPARLTHIPVCAGFQAGCKFWRGGGGWASSTDKADI